MENEIDGNSFEQYMLNAPKSEEVYVTAAVYRYGEKDEPIAASDEVIRQLIVKIEEDHSFLTRKCHEISLMLFPIEWSPEDKDYPESGGKWNGGI